MDGYISIFHRLIDWFYFFGFVSRMNQSQLIVAKIEDKRVTKFQSIEVYKSSFWGHIMNIDGDLMLTERDESGYHEMIAHIPLVYLPKASNVLIIGGGDGGTLKQILMHPNVKKVTLVDIDAAVIAASKGK